MTWRVATRRDNRSLWPYLALLGAMASFATGSSFAKHLFPVMGATGTTVYRVGFSAMLLMAMWRPWRRSWSRTEFMLVARYGIVLGLMNLSFYMALRTIPLGLAIAIELLGPLTVALMNSHRAIHFLWVGVAVAGLALLLPVADVKGTLDPIGILFALGAAFFWALYIVFGKKAAHLPPGAAVAVGLAFATLAVLPVGLAVNGLGLLNPHAMLLGLVVAVLSSALPYSLEMVALRHIPERSFGVVLSADPAIGALAAYLVLGETLTGRQGMALACVIAAAIGAVMTQDKKAQG
ncbi:DMT family transporter [Sphingobium sp. LB126]|uniref:EamA family transporter n=1 Tax=Sphingobium sp. LB126 TaxID=1983755 RepID=UPI001F5BB7F5|nr:DMT family transporter [Sphingobium sp. LB126]